MSAGHDLQRVDPLPDAFEAWSELLAAAVLLVATTDETGTWHADLFIRDLAAVRRSAFSRLVEAVERAAPGAVERAREEVQR